MTNKTTEALKLAEHEKQEPVAYTNKEQLGYLKDERYKASPMAMWATPVYDNVNIPLYAAPVSAKREWVDLTGMEHQSIYDDHHAMGGCWTDGFEYERAVIAAFKEKNK